MHPKRLADLLFLYAGALHIGHYTVAHGVQVVPGSAWQLVSGSTFCALAAYRWTLPPDETKPSAYGPLVYVLVALCALMTLLTAGLIVA